MRTTMGRQAYSSDLTDGQWTLLEPLVPQPSLEGRRPFVERREILNAILYVLRSGCPWRLLPHEFPDWQTVYYSFRRWQREGVWDQILRTLRMEVRKTQGREAEPSAAVIDSQSIKTSAVRGPQKDFDMGGKIWGSKRTALVDSQGHLLEGKVHAADWSDQRGAKEMLEPLAERYPRMKLVWGDSHCAGTFIGWLKTHLGWIMQPVRALTMPKRGVLVPEGEEVDWDKLFPKGFRPLPRRWVIERSFAWIARWRRFCRDYEGLPESSESFIKLSHAAQACSGLPVLTVFKHYLSDNSPWVKTQGLLENNISINPQTVFRCSCARGLHREERW